MHGSVHDEDRAISDMLVPQSITFDPEEKRRRWMSNQKPVQVQWLIFIPFGG